MDHFIEKLEKILQHYSLTASGFADRVGVQRSSLSHLLSGRNKPSLDFILKIIEAFPEVDLNWILLDQGTFPKSKIKPAPTSPMAAVDKENEKESNTSEIENKPLTNSNLELFETEKKSPENLHIPTASIAEAFPEVIENPRQTTPPNVEEPSMERSNVTKVETVQTVQENSQTIVKEEVSNKFVSTNILEQPTRTIPTVEKIEKEATQEKVLENNENKNPLVQAMLQRDAVEMIAVLFKDGTFKEYWKKT